MYQNYPLALINPQIAMIVKRLPKITVDSNDIVWEESDFLLVFCGDRSLTAWPAVAARSVDPGPGHVPRTSGQSYRLLKQNGKLLPENDYKIVKVKRKV